MRHGWESSPRGCCRSCLRSGSPGRAGAPRPAHGPRPLPLLLSQCRTGALLERRCAKTHRSPGLGTYRGLTVWPWAYRPSSPHHPFRASVSPLTHSGEQRSPACENKTGCIQPFGVSGRKCSLKACGRWGAALSAACSRCAWFPAPCRGLGCRGEPKCRLQAIRWHAAAGRAEGGQTRQLSCQAQPQLLLETSCRLFRKEPCCCSWVRTKSPSCSLPPRGWVGPWFASRKGLLSACFVGTGLCGDRALQGQGSAAPAAIPAAAVLILLVPALEGSGSIHPDHHAGTGGRFASVG